MSSTPDSSISQNSISSGVGSSASHQNYFVPVQSICQQLIEDRINYFLQISKTIQAVKEKFSQNCLKIYEEIDETTHEISRRIETRNSELKLKLYQSYQEKMVIWERQLKLGERAITELKDYRHTYFDSDTLDMLCQRFSDNIGFVDAGEIIYKPPDANFFKAFQNFGSFSNGTEVRHPDAEWGLCKRISPKLVIGGTGDIPGRFCRPWGICSDATRRILVSDRLNHRIQIFNEAGNFILQFGKEGSGQGEFSRPAGLAVDGKCRIIVADKDNHRIQVFTYSGSFLFTFGSYGSKPGQFFYPWDVAVNSGCDIAVSDSKNHRLQLFNQYGQFITKLEFDSTRAGLRQLDCPRGLTFMPNDTLLVTDFNNHRVLFVNKNFTKIHPFGQEGTRPGEFLRPQGIACDSTGRFAVADSKNYRIQIFDRKGKFLTEFGARGLGPGLFDCPQDICFHPNGTLAVVDLNSNKIQVF